MLRISPTRMTLCECDARDDGALLFRRDGCLRMSRSRLMAMFTASQRPKLLATELLTEAQRAITLDK